MGVLQFILASPTVPLAADAAPPESKSDLPVAGPPGSDLPKSDPFGFKPATASPGLTGACAAAEVNKVASARSRISGRGAPGDAQVLAADGQERRRHVRDTNTQLYLS